MPCGGKNYKKSKWGNRRFVRKCSCGGNIWEYEPIGFLPKILKCDRCGTTY